MNITLLPENLVGDPEVVAMIQAFYSRSATPIKERLKELGSHLPEIKAALGRYYVGYNHSSIGDCGNTAIFFEGVSMLFAKALEDNPLFNGQETSTRFISFNPANLIKGKWLGNGLPATAIQKTWMSFYTTNLPLIQKKLAERHPKTDHLDLTDAQWAGSINARAFDIMRAFLPAGCTTQFSFYGSLRTLREALSSLRFHPLSEVRSGAVNALKILSARYPTTYLTELYNKDSSSFLEKFNPLLFYNYNSIDVVLDSYPKLSGSIIPEYPNITSTESERRLKVLKYKAVEKTGLPIIVSNHLELPEYVKTILNERPKGKTVPFSFGRFGSFNVDFLLDYGSFRDVQRHRNCKIPLPVLTDNFGIHDWYLQQIKDLDETVVSSYNSTIGNIYTLSQQLNVDSVEQLFELQYIHPMGMQVPVEMTLALDEMFYIAELRSSRTVHPTLRPIAQAMGNFLESKGLKVYIDTTKDAFVSHRGKQDIVKV